MLIVTLLLLFAFNLYHRHIDGLWFFLNIHLFSLSLYLTYQSGYLHPLRLDFFVLYIFLLLAFFLGYKIVAERAELKIEVDISNLKLRRLNFLNYVAFLFFLAAFGYEWKMAGFVLPIFAANKLQAYVNFPQSFVHYLVGTGIPISIALAFCAKYCTSRVIKVVNWVLIAIVSLLLTSILARAVLVLQVFGVIFMLFRLGMGPRRLRPRHFLWPTAALLVFTFLSGGLRTDSSNLAAIIDIALMKWPAWTAPFAWFYIYLTTPIENLRYGWENLTTFTYGYLTLGTVPMTFLERATVKEVSDSFYQEFLNSEGFNTSGLFGTILKDYGVFGILYTFVLGALTVVVSSSRKLFVVMFSPIWLFALMTSVTNDYISQFFFFVYFVYLFLIDKLSGATITIRKARPRLRSARPVMMRREPRVPHEMDLAPR